MDKLKMHSPDLSQDNIAKIRELFPGCVTEARDDKTGKLRLAVDFDQLRQELSDQIVEGPQERYRLDWPGAKEKSRACCWTRLLSADWATFMWMRVWPGRGCILSTGLMS